MLRRVQEDGTRGRGLVPSGASTGQFEALELRDGDASRFRGRSVSRAVRNVIDVIGPAIRGANAADQSGIDRTLIELDRTPNKGRLGANAGMLKVGSLVRGERTAKWNEVLRIERQLLGQGRFAGATPLVRRGGA